MLKRIKRSVIKFLLIVVCLNAMSQAHATLGRRFSSVPIGSIFCFAKDSSYLYAGTDSGVFRSSNNGLTWITYSNIISKLSIRNISVYSTTIYAATYSDIYMSSDSCANWKRLNAPPNRPVIYGLARMDSSLFTATDVGMFLLTNNGTWKPINAGLTDINTRKLTTFKNTLIVGTPSGPYISTDQGTTWSLRNKGLGLPNVIALEVYFSDNLGLSWVSGTSPGYEILSISFRPDRIYAGTSNGLFYSFDAGMHWALTDSVSYKNTIYAVITKGHSIVAASSLGLRYSLDDGDTWAYSDQGAKEIFDPIHEFIVYPNPTKEIINIHFIDESLPSSFRLINLEGQEIKVAQTYAGAEMVLNLNAITKGMYILIVQSGTQTFTRKILLR
jgi:ligand-binding sensor domain-containing protein